MNQDTVLNLASQAMSLALDVAGPIMLVGLIVGVVVSLFQAVTQIQDQSLSFVPKIAAMAIMILILGPFMLDRIVNWVTNLWTSIPSLIG